MSDYYYVTFKLITGEQLLGEVTTQNDYSITVMNPFIVVNRTTVTRDGRMMDQMTANPYCTYAADPIFTFELKHIIFIKELKSDIVSKYLDLVHEMNMREMLADDVDEYVAALEKLLGYTDKEEQQEEPTEEDYLNSIHFLEGNETLH